MSSREDHSTGKHSADPLRLGFSQATPAQIEEGVRRLADLVHTVRTRLESAPLEAAE